MSSINIISFDRNSQEDLPKINFTMSVELTQIVVSYKAIVNNSIKLVSVDNLRLFRDNEGIFTLPIPKNTNCILIGVGRVVRPNAPSVLITRTTVPSECGYLFTLSDLSLYLTVNHCNTVAIDTSGFDHLPLSFNESRVRHQIGPCRSSRAMAMVHLAMMEAYIAINGKYKSYLNLPRTSDGITEVAMLEAFYKTLISLYPTHSVRLNELYIKQMDTFPDTSKKTLSIIIGTTIANAVIKNRETDGSDHKEQVIGVDYIVEEGVGVWEKDPISNIPIALGSLWGNVKPFVLTSSSIHRTPELPPLDSEIYSCAFNEVSSIGGDGINTTTSRSQFLYDVGVYWAYDGVPNLCAPPRLYNQITHTIALTQLISGEKLLLLYYLINVGMADSAIASWESKYYYKFWRPITGIRKAKQNGGDGNTKTIEDPNWTPIGAPASNSNGLNFTPPFPAYPSGHSTFGGTIFQIMRRFFEKDNIEFTFVSDELNGITEDNQNNVRPLKPRTFHSLSEAEEENGQSRMYLGIHWNFDKTEGTLQGNKVGDDIFNALL